MNEIISIKLLMSEMLKTQINSNIEIIYVLSKNIDLILEQQQYHMSEGDFILVNANKKFRIEKKDKDALAICFEINYSKLTEYMGINQILFWCNTVTDKDETQIRLRDLMNQILNLYFHGTAESKFRMKSLQYEMIYLLISNFMAKTIEENLQLLEKEETRVFEIKNYIHANYYKQLSLKELADQLHFSQGYLSRYIKQNFGMNFLEYLNSIRLFHAVDDLLYSDKRIVEIAVDNGYPTSTAFNKAFKNCYNMTPTEYRKDMRKEASFTENQEDSVELEEERVKEYLKVKYQPAVEVQSKNKKVLEADAEKSRELKTPWTNLLNAGDAAMLLQSDYQEHIKIICSKLKFKYIRIWNLFSLCFYSSEEIENKKMNFNKLDRVLDFLLELGVRPHIELSMKPQLFIAKADKIIYFKEADVSPQSNQEYGELVNRLMLHLINRYGIEKIEKWRFELWKDQKIDVQKDETSYYEMFETVYQILKKYSSQIKLGGPGIILGYENFMYQSIFENWKKRKIQPDFLSVYSYGYVTYQKDGEFYREKSRDSRYVMHQLELMRDIMEQCGFSVKNIYVTEWGYTISNRNVLNDGCNMGAYILQNYIEAEGNIEVLSYAQATDLLSEYYDTNAVFNGDLGLLSKDGICKPSFYAFSFLQDLNKSIIGKNENTIITTNDKKGFVIVCHNMKKQTYQSISREENEIQIAESGTYENQDELYLDIIIKNVPNGEYRIKNSFINEANGSAQDNWMRMGFPEELSENETDYLKMISVPHIKLEKAVVKDQILKIKVCLSAHEIRMIKIDYHYREE